MRKLLRLRMLLLILMAAGFSGLFAEDSPLNIELRVGLGKNTLIGKDMPPRYELDYPKTTGTFGIGASYRISHHLDIYTLPQLKTRYYEANSSSGWNLDAKSLYLDVPILLRTRIANTDIGLGPNLAFALRNAVGGNVPGLNAVDAKDVADFIPGYCVSATYRFTNHPRMSLNFFYRWDAIPYSSSWGFDKTQESGGVSFGYTMFDGGTKDDLLPVSRLSEQGKDNHYLQLGVKKQKFPEGEAYMPYFRTEHSSYIDQKWGLGYISTIGVAHTTDGNYSLSILRTTLQRHLSRKIGRIEPYFAPGLGGETILAVDDSPPSIMDEDPRVFLLPNLMFVLEAGVKIRILDRLSLSLFADRILTTFYTSDYSFGAGIVLQGKKAKNLVIPAEAGIQH